MLTPTERAWLIEQRALLVEDTAKADVYAGALLMLVNDKGRWWNLTRVLTIWWERRRLTRVVDLWTDHAYRRALAIDAWLAVYHVTTGEDRGPQDLRDWPLTHIER